MTETVDIKFRPAGEIATMIADWTQKYKECELRGSHSDGDIVTPYQGGGFGARVAVACAHCNMVYERGPKPEEIARYNKIFDFEVNLTRTTAGPQL